ncbi:MAG: hotdog domain-containing protein [Novosphingobium sp.]
MTEQIREPVIRITAMPADANAYGDIFGGWLMSLMDMGAGLIAARRSHGRAVTVAMDGVHFHLPVKVGDEVSVYGTLVKVPEARFTFVAVDDSGKPRAIEPGTIDQEY